MGDILNLCANGARSPYRKAGDDADADAMLCTSAASCVLAQSVQLGFNRNLAAQSAARNTLAVSNHTLHELISDEIWPYHRPYMVA